MELEILIREMRMTSRCGGQDRADAVSYYTMPGAKKLAACLMVDGRGTLGCLEQRRRKGLSTDGSASDGPCVAGRSSFSEP